MTETGIYYPEHITTSQLDTILERGWYRMGQGVFTCDYIIKEEIYYRVYWLRYQLKNLSLGSSQQQIIKRNRRFSVYNKPFELTEELEALYAAYKTGIDFDPSPSVRQWLFKDDLKNIFDTWLVEVRDSGRLIAAGVFDQGEESISGIMGFYHPEYKKYSLGKYLLLLKTIYAQDAGKKWYYPGYLVQGLPKFNYKLFLDEKATQVFLPELNRWLPWKPELTGVSDISSTESTPPAIS